MNTQSLLLSVLLIPRSLAMSWAEMMEKFDFPPGKLAAIKHLPGYTQTCTTEEASNYKQNAVKDFMRKINYNIDDRFKPYYEKWKSSADLLNEHGEPLADGYTKHWWWSPLLTGNEEHDRQMMGHKDSVLVWDRVIMKYDANRRMVPIGIFRPVDAYAGKPQKSNYKFQRVAGTAPIEGQAAPRRRLDQLTTSQRGPRA